MRSVSATSARRSGSAATNSSATRGRASCSARSSQIVSNRALALSRDCRGRAPLGTIGRCGRGRAGRPMPGRLGQRRQLVEPRAAQAGQVGMRVLGQVERGDHARRHPRVRRERPDAGHRAQHHVAGAVRGALERKTLDHLDQQVFGHVHLQRPVPVGQWPAVGARGARAGQHQAFVRQQVDQALGRAGLEAARTRATVQTWQLSRAKSPFGEAGFSA